MRPIRSLVAREPSGSSAPGRYLPVSTPWPSGDHTICEMPFARQSGITSRSGSRCSSEYCGCEETNVAQPCSRLRSSEAWIWSAVHSLKPM